MWKNTYSYQRSLRHLHSKHFINKYLFSLGKIKLIFPNCTYYLRTVSYHILGMHLSGPFYGENQLNFKKYESTYFIHNLNNTEFKDNSSESQIWPHSNILLLNTTNKDNTTQQKVKPTIWQSYTKGARQTVTQNKHNTTTQNKAKQTWILTTLYKLWDFIFQVFKLLHPF